MLTDRDYLTVSPLAHLVFFFYFGVNTPDTFERDIDI